jgi:hypothetical protein
MASINDIGGATPDTLDDPPLGGPDGWAAAVRNALNSSDTPVDTRITTASNTAAAGQKTSLTPSNGWGLGGAPFAGAHVTRQGALVTVEGLLVGPASLACTPNTSYPVGNIPAGYRPTHDLITAQQLTYNGNAPYGLCQVQVITDGRVLLFVSAAGTFTGGFITIATTYRGA